jgi:hypothetical protein
MAKPTIPAELGYIRTETVITIPEGHRPDAVDGRKSRFTVTEVTFARRTDLGTYWVGLKGRRYDKHNTWAEIGYAITPAGEITPHHRLGPAPDFVNELFDRLAAGEFRAGVYAHVPAGEDRFA